MNPDQLIDGAGYGPSEVALREAATPEIAATIRYSHMQLSFIDDVRIDKLVQKLASATISETELNDDVVIPAMHQRRYYLVSAKVRGVDGKSKEDSAGNDVLTKTVTLAPEDVVELTRAQYDLALDSR